MLWGLNICPLFPEPERVRQQEELPFSAEAQRLRWGECTARGSAAAQKPGFSAHVLGVHPSPNEASAACRVHAASPRSSMWFGDAPGSSQLVLGVTDTPSVAASLPHGAVTLKCEYSVLSKFEIKSLPLPPLGLV